MNSIRINFPDDVPLVQWEDGSIRVKGTRLLLAMIVSSFQQGDTPDEINDSFPSASVTQIKAVIDWYLNNQSVADAYLQEYYARGERLRLEIQSEPEYIAKSEILKRKREEFLQRRREELIKT
ncbi:MAG TPA: DUF433 domain-containing protein [Pyrinomonadaceae bacterium]|jgi:uncharacterized protein (DUF433 family)|nr:DUF433 domain-containing protein [Pyrinomonadaceae bacterium]